MAGDEGRCRKHLSMPCGGVCAHCLLDRLLRLCPDCACARPCSCACSSASTSSSSSASGSAVGRVYSFVERDGRVGRSRSVAVSGSVDEERRRSKVWGWVSFRKPTAGGKGVDVEPVEVAGDPAALPRSSSVSARVAPKAGGWERFLPGPIKALRYLKSSRAGSGDYPESVR